MTNPRKRNFLLKDTVQEQQRRVALGPGEYYASDEKVVISTLLGSCVAACLYDPIHRIVGMNHFLLTDGIGEDGMSVCDIDPGKYGTCSMDFLIDDMLKLGAEHKNLHAKVFGGGSMFKPFEECRLGHCVGNMNGIFVLEFLKKERIHVVSKDLGGEKGRAIHFFPDNYAVYVRKIKNRTERFSDF
ncbi:MAG: hypothetical protein B6245_11285 [Desulfobacteraceae bacterium 4572_88]|nr:MAG: hypothetical protein B6245_11285 [Desulfobacteraceae bacterium 4572_88]